jgi:hypothetical protein
MIKADGLNEKMRRVSEVLNFRRRFPSRESHEHWRHSAEALVEILSDPRLAQWPEKYTDWN